MTAPLLSVVAPAWNEERYIETFLEQVSRYLNSTGLPWEIIVADDGSSDRTAALVEAWTRSDARVRLVSESHSGKGGALRAGMRAAHGEWRLMADTDLSVAPGDWAVFVDEIRNPSGAQIVIGSREAAGARRVGEPVLRHVIGRVFNWVVQLLALPGINDTQCGFKMFSRAASGLFAHLTIEGFAFDVELLFLARRAGFTIREAGILWVCRRDSRVRLSRGAAAFLDVARIRVKYLKMNKLR